MPTLKTATMLPTPAQDAAITAAAMAHPGALPFTDAEQAQVKPLARRGRPLGSGTKTQVTLPLALEIVEKFKASGDGWKTGINDALKSWIQSHA